ncbi:NAD-dependent malic enzyme, partial [Georgenia sp. 10Sc9-8]|nr:NAD-dependent malic enzyme [Georgenia halotolerans]
RIVVSGVGAAGSAIIKLLIAQGAQHIVAFGRGGALHRDAANGDEYRTWIAEHTNVDSFDGTLREGLDGADVFIGVSAGGILDGEDIAVMNDGAIVFALANPEPEVDPIAAAAHATVVATGRSDYPNQINNVLAFPGLFRGLLDAGVHQITDEMLRVAAVAIAEVVSDEELNASFVIPGVFDTRVAESVAEAVQRAVVEGRAAERP